MAGNEVRIKASVTGNAKQEIGGIRDAWAKFQREGGQGVKAGLTAAAAAKGFMILDTAISGGIQVMGDAVDAASDLNETLSKSGAVFGDNADEISAWGDEAAEAMGLSKQAAVEAAASFGDLFNKVGLTADQSVAMSQNLVALSADLASFNNLAGGSAEALEKIKSGLAGETEPLRSVGVFLNEAKVKAKAAELGLIGLNGTLTEGAKIQARYALILEETASAQGDFARTSDQLANKQRINSAKLDNALARLGNILLPAVTDAASLAADALDGFSASLDLLGGKLPDTNEELGQLLFFLGLLAPAAGDAGSALAASSGKAGELADAHRDAGDAAGGLAGALAGTGGAASDLGGSLDIATSAAQDTRKAATALEGALEDLTEAAYDAVDAFGDQAYSSDELKGRLGELEEQLFEAKRELLELEAIKNPTAAQQRDITIARGKVAGYRHDIFDTRIELAKLDDTTLAGLLQELSKAQYRTDVLGDEAREALSLFQKLSFAESKVTGFKGDPGYAPRADGGPVTANTPYLVGEEGPEVFVPGASGTIIPNGGSGGGWSGGGMTFSPTVVIQGIATPATVQAIVNDLGPAFADYMTRSGWVPR